MGNQTKYTPAEQELTRILLTELLAHQFCFPVQWIKTQDAILNDFATERLIEIGPAETLVNMMQKTLKGGYQSHDIAHGLKRELLSYEKDSGAIYYDQSNQADVPPSIASVAAPAQVLAPLSPEKVQTPVALSTGTTVPLTAITVPDVAVSQLDTITSLIAIAFNKKTRDIAQDKSVKAICGGRSTLQNEIIGDLAKEFGSLPDQPEDIPLTDLAKTLSDSGLGTKLGPRTNAIICKVTTSKMPAGSNVTALRQYLDIRWGFKAGLQERALLSAISLQPSERLDGEKEVQDFLDGIAQGVLRGVGIDPSTLTAGSDQQSDANNAVISSEALEILQGELRKTDEALLGVYTRRLGHDINGASNEITKAKATIGQLQAKNDNWSAEHGEEYERGITPAFDVKKVRKYDSYWNWGVEQVVALFSACMVGQFDKFLAGAKSSLDSIPPRATPHLLQVISFLTRTLSDLAAKQLRQEAAQEWLTGLETACRSSIDNHNPFFRHSVVSGVPVLDMDERGNITVKEIPRMIRPSEEAAPSLGAYDGDSEETESLTDSQSYYGCFSATSAPLSIFSRQPATRTGSPISSADDAAPVPSPGTASPNPRMSSTMWIPGLRTKGREGWHTNYDITNGYLRWFQRSSMEGVSFADKTILVTGSGRRSIGSEIVAMSLAAGAKILVTTSSYSKQTCDYYMDLYQQHGARGSQLVIVPFNGGSKQDVSKLVKYIFDDESNDGLGWDLDHIVPFAAVGETDQAIDNIGDRSELAHRVMLTNLVRLLGSVKAAKAQRRITTHPTHVILPLSPNHGVFGKDGLYGESKMALEAVLNKWWSEDWSEYLTLCGTVIGWTRGTGLMSNNDIIATGIEADLGIRTFSAPEMAWHIMGLMDAGTASFCDLEPLIADLSGGLSAFINLKPVLQQIQETINSKSEINKSIYKEQLRELGESIDLHPRLQRKARIGVERARLPEYEEIQPLAAKLHDMVDLERVVVVVGFGEVGPCGSARTRWEAECSGVFSLNGCVELAWIMGLIRYHNGSLNGKDYCGWLDAETKMPITDEEVKTKYEDDIIQHTGIRIIERQDHDLTSLDREQKLHEVVITEGLKPFEVSLATAEELQREHGDKAVINEAENGQFSVTLKAGATLWVPKASESQSTIGAQMPTGWDPRTYGIPEDIISQVDPITLYALVATVEAFLSAGLTDPYELYKHIHVSELGNALGASLGGVKSLESMFKRRFLDSEVQNDILAETFINTTAAWVNMLLLGSSGPIRTPVGACATSLESLDTGYDLILNGRAKAVLVGGTDALERDTAHEFARMKATINATEDRAAGRTPKEASRPTTSTRAGFVEGQGCGVQLLTTARLALDMGLPIRAVIALTHTASDRIGRSVPSPGKGLLTIATEKRTCKFASPLLDFNHRRRQLSLRLRQIKDKADMELTWLNERIRTAQHPFSAGPIPDEYLTQCRSEILSSAHRARAEALNTYGNAFYTHDPTISPLRGALAVWGLTIDDLSVASLHGTSTKQNDLNETAVIQSQLSFLGRSDGNILPCCAQKALLGHGKGAAGAFAVNSCLQMLATDLIPGNPNADNIDADLQGRHHLFFPSKSYRLPGGVKAFSVTSFGFGQKGAQVIGVSAKYLFATLTSQEYEGYKRQVRGREREVDRALQRGMYGGVFVGLKEKNVYADGKLEETLLCRG